MQSELDPTVRWRVALTVLLVSALTGGVIFRIVTARGPSWVFYAISAGVLALVAIDMWDKLRAARTLLRGMRPTNPLSPVSSEMTIGASAQRL